jgi:arabinan endo-1,5-alpha-L-arabinosidase
MKGRLVLSQVLKITLLVAVIANPCRLMAEVLVGAHDPTVIRDTQGVYTLLTTNNLLQIRQSTDEINWTAVGNIVPAVPAWVTTILGPTVTDIWAPDARYRNGTYWVYYACSSFGTNNSVIGLATNPTLDTAASNYKWTDQGLVFQSTTADDYNAIDPASYVDLNGNVWMLFGSFWDGIKMIAIDPTTGKQLASNPTIYSLASRGGGAIEGSTMIEHQSDYYLFTSWDACCEGVSSTYNVRVGRSASVTGPYVDESGVNLMDSGGTEVLQAYGIYIGPGGGSAIHDGRRDFYCHHYYNANENGNPYLHNREIVWDNQGWPHLTQPYMGHHNALEAEHAQLVDVNFAQTASASNGEYINNIDAADSQVIFHFNALASETYELRILYANTGTTASTHLVTVDGNPAMTVTYPPTAASGTFSLTQAVTVSAPMTEGYNMVSFKPGTGQAELDRVDVLRPAGNLVPGGSNDNGVSYTYQAAANAATLSASGWAEYEYLDFQIGGYNSLSVAFEGSCTGPLRFVLDSLTGSVAVTTTVNVTGPATIIVPLPASYTGTTGIHDVYVQYNGTGTCPLQQFQFSLSGATNTPTPTNTYTNSPTPTPTRTVTSTASTTRTNTATNTPTASATPSASVTPTKTTTYTQTATNTLTASATPSLTPTKTTTASPSNTASPSATSTGIPSPTRTPTPTATSTTTPTVSFTPTTAFSSTGTATGTPTSTQTSTPSMTLTFTSSPTLTASRTSTDSPTSSGTPTLTPTGTLPPTNSPTDSMTPSATASPTLTATPSSTTSWTPTASSTATDSMTPTASLTATPSASPTRTSTATASPSSTGTETPTSTPIRTASSTATSTVMATRTPTPSSTSTFTLTASPIPTLTPTFTLSETSTPLATGTSTTAHTATPTSTPTGTGGVVLFPNPATGPGPVTLQVTLSSAGQVQISVFTTAFRKVNTMTLSNVPAGTTDVALPLTDQQGTPLANGLYYVVVRTPQGRFITKLMILR